MDRNKVPNLISYRGQNQTIAICCITCVRGMFELPLLSPGAGELIINDLFFPYHHLLMTCRTSQFQRGTVAEQE